MTGLGAPAGPGASCLGVVAALLIPACRSQKASASRHHIKMLMGRFLPGGMSRSERGGWNLLEHCMHNILQRYRTVSCNFQATDTSANNLTCPAVVATVASMD